MKRPTLFFASLYFGAIESAGKIKRGFMGKESKTAEPGRIYSFEMRTNEGAPKPLSDYKGQVLLIVNTASLCGFTPQYDSLESVYRKYKDRGLRVLAFPANNFGSQEPGPDNEIKEFCRTRYSVSFDLFSKISVKGADAHPLYRFLTNESGFNGGISWNFTKFLVDRRGKIAARFGPPVDPSSEPVTRIIEDLLG